MKFLFFFYFLFFLSCSKMSKNKDIVVSVFDNFLYQEDLVKNCGPFLSKQDSVRKVNIYIDEWIKDKLILHKASINLSNDSLINTQVEKYKNQLLKHNYQKNMIASKLDTIVLSEEVNSFYQQNINDFILHEDVFRYRYAILDVNSPNLKKFESNFIAFNDIDYLNKYCLRNSIDYNFDDTKWVSLNKLKHKINLNQYDFNFDINKLNLIDLGDYYFYYILTDFVPEFEFAPIGYCEIKIKDIILRNRIKLFLNKLENDIFDLELSNNNVKYY